MTESLEYFLEHQDELQDHQNQLLRKPIRQSDTRLSREIAQQQIKDILSYAEGGNYYYFVIIAGIVKFFVGILGPHRFSLHIKSFLNF